MINTLLGFKTIFDDGLANPIIDIVFIVLILVLLNLALDFVIKRKIVIIPLAIFSVTFLISYILCFSAFNYLSLTFIVLIALTGLFANLAEVRVYFSNKAPQKRNDKIKEKKKGEVEKIFDHNELYKTINETVLYLSKHKIGALITFERKDKLVDIIKNGTLLNCPVSFELLITIFYPGTRLHDGAVVIKDDKIIAASVYYTPTTKPLSGKYGSRHRAGIGISEICDAVTVVVSEETGRISIAYNGELETYNKDTFISAFENIMAMKDIEEEKE